MAEVGLVDFRFRAIDPFAFNFDAFFQVAQDLCQVTTGEVEAYFYTSPDTHRVVLLEIQADSRQDRLEVYFDNYQSTAVQGLGGAATELVLPVIPTRLRSRYGPDTPMVIDLQQLVVSEEKESE